MIPEPHPESLASLVLLSREYSKAQLSKWLNFRDEVLDEFIAEHGELFCTMCDKRPLLREMPEFGMRQSHDLATIDHVVPRSKGGGEYEKGNCAVVCYQCNQKKKDKMPV